MKIKKMIAVIMTLLMTVLLSGCVQMVFDINIHEDMSADIQMKVGIAEGFYDMAGGDEALNMDEAIADGYTVESYNDSGYIGKVVKGKIDDVTKENEVLGELSSGSFITIEESGSKKIIKMSIPSDAITGSLEEEAGISTEDFSLYGKPDMRIIVTFPYEVKEHNASSVDGNTLTWNILEVTDSEMYAVCEVSNGKSNAMTYLGIGGAAVAVIGIIALIGYKKGKK